MKKNILGLLVLILSSCSELQEKFNANLESQSSKVHGYDQVDGNGKPLSTSKQAMVGIELELFLPFFKKRPSGEISYFEPEKVIYQNVEENYCVDADWYSGFGFSTLEITTQPFFLNKSGISSMMHTVQLIENKFTKVKNSCINSQKGKKGAEVMDQALSRISSESSKKRLGKEILNILKEGNSFEKVTEEVFPRIPTATGEEFKTYVLCDERAIISPQLTFPLSLEAIYKLSSNLYEKELKVEVPEKGKQALNRFMKKINSPEGKRLLGKENENNTKLKGFLALVFLYTHHFENTNESLTLKLNLPFLKCRNDFGVLFLQLTQNDQNFLREKNNFLKIISFLKSYDSIEQLKKPLIPNDIHPKYSKEKRKIFQSLTTKSWLDSISKGMDILSNDNFKLYFPEAEAWEVLEIKNAGFGLFGLKLENINDKGASIFEWRDDEVFHIENLSNCTEYINKLTNFCYEINSLKD